MEPIARSTQLDLGAAANAGRSISVFLVATVTAIAAFVGRWGAAGVVLSFLIAFGITEALARRFPEGVRLRWVFRPNLLAAGVVTLLLLLSLSLLATGVTCIEGGRVVGSPFPFYFQCNGPTGIPEEPEFNVVGLALDIAIWYLLGAFVAALVRPRKPYFLLLA